MPGATICPASAKWCGCHGDGQTYYKRAKRGCTTAKTYYNRGMQRDTNNQANFGIQTFGVGPGECKLVVIDWPAELN